MPQDLDEAYKRILTQFIPDTSRLKQYEKYLRRMLLWLCFATRPLKIAELSEAVVVEEDDNDIDEDSRLRKPDILYDLGQGLFELDRTSELISLSHSSIKTLLTSPETRTSKIAIFHMDEFGAHDVIMKTCLAYLRFSSLKFRTTQFAYSNDALALRYPLLSYATHCWPLHVRHVGESSWNSISAFFSTKEACNGGNYGFWIQYISGGLSPEVIIRTTPLYYAASFGYKALVAAILYNDKNLNLEQGGGRRGSTALQVAAFRRQREVVKLLVEAGANPFSHDGSGIGGGFSSVFWAGENGWDDIVELMIRCGTANGFRPQKRLPHDEYTRKVAQLVQISALEHENPQHKPTINRIHDTAAYGGNVDVVRKFLLENFAEEQSELL